MRGHNSGYLFSDGDLYATLEAQRNLAVESIELVPREQFLATSADTLLEHLAAKYAVEPLAVQEEKMVIKRR